MEMRKVNDEIEAKKQQIASLEKQMADSMSASQNKVDNFGLSPPYAELVEQLNEKSFELEVKTADNRIIQDQLNQKICECEELQVTVASLKRQLAQALDKKDSCSTGDKSQNCALGTNSRMELQMNKQTQPSRDITAELLQNAHLASEVEELKQKVMELTEAKGQLEARNQKLAEESAYAKGLASAAGVELKALSEEVTKLMNHNELMAAELTSVRNSSLHRVSNGPKNTRRDSHIKRHELTSKRELNASYERERERAFEAALTEKEQREAELQKKVEESKQREAFLENELANMWVLVAKMKKSHGNETNISEHQ